MNYIPQIAKMLGVEIGEEFKVTGYGGKYSFLDSGLCYYDKQRQTWTQAEDYVLIDIIRGTEEISPIPFEPKELQEYWFLGTFNGEPKIYSTFWITETGDNAMEHYARKYCGNMFRTKSEAEREKYNVYKRLTGKESKE